jgi:hypothetical protein
MNSNNYSSVRGFTGLILFGSLLLACALSSRHANASFEEAVKALQVQDGTATLAEVSKAVEQDRDDGLLVFLNALAITDRKHPEAIDNIFTAEQFDTLTQLLDKAVENGSARAKWVLHIMPKYSHKLRPTWKKWQVAAKESRPSRSSKFSTEEIEWMELKLAELEDIAAQGSSDAAAELYEFYGVRGTYSGMFYSHTKAKKGAQTAAELGHPLMALMLGFKKLHWVSDLYYSHSPCLEKSAFEPVCFEMNRAEGIYWLKQAFQYIDRYPIGYTGLIHEMALLEQAGALTGEPRPKEAFLWVMYGLNRVTDSLCDYSRESFIFLLKKMRENGELQKVAPKLAEVWDDKAQRNLLLRPSRLPELPSMISHIRALPAHGELPVVSIILDDKNGLAFDVYESGKVTVAFLFNGIKHLDEEQLIRLSPAELKEFLSKVTQLHMEKWPSSQLHWGNGSSRCMEQSDFQSDNYQITVRLKNAERTVLFSQPKKVPDLKDSRQPQIDLVYSLIEQYLAPPFFASLFMN